MSRLFELRQTPTDVVLRAAAIASVTFHHTNSMDFGGGMAFLVMLSGTNFARFAVKNGTEAGIRQSILAIARQIFFPSLTLILLSFAAYQKFDLLELMFIRHNPPGISAFPVWFSHMMIQVLVALYLVFSIPSVARATVRHPSHAMLLLFCVGLLLRLIGRFYLPLPFLLEKLVYMPWNFLLGGAVYFLAVDASTSTRGTRWLALACVISGTMAAYDPDNLRFWWLMASGPVLVFVRYIPLPYMLMRIVTAVSAASFGIFLTHIIWIRVGRHFTEVWPGPHAAGQTMILFVFALLMGTLTWAAFTAFGRAYRALQPESVRPALAQ